MNWSCCGEVSCPYMQCTPPMVLLNGKGLARSACTALMYTVHVLWSMIKCDYGMLYHNRAFSHEWMTSYGLFTSFPFSPFEALLSFWQFKNVCLLAACSTWLLCCLVLNTASASLPPSLTCSPTPSSPLQLWQLTTCVVQPCMSLFVLVTVSWWGRSSGWKETWPLFRSMKKPVSL